MMSSSEKFSRALYSAHLRLKKNLELYLDRSDALRCFVIADRIYEAIVKGTVEELRNLRNFVTFTKDNYVETLCELIRLEEAHQALELRKSDRDSTVRDMKPRGVISDNLVWIESFEQQGVSSKHPAIVGGDFVALCQVDGDVEVIRIMQIEGDSVVLCKRSQRYNIRQGLRICFVSSGTPYEYIENAILHYSRTPWLERVVFGDDDDEAPGAGPALQEPKVNVGLTNTEQLVERLHRLNPSQRQAVGAILESRCRPKPYLLFGPPGTGKTATIIETVVQVQKRQPECSILVCVNSNNCADHLLTKLKETNQLVRLVRLNAGQKFEDKLEILVDDLDGLHIDDSDDDFESDPLIAHRSRPRPSKLGMIIVTTNIKAGSLQSYKFDFVILDEAGHANEAESLVPISRLKPDGSLILAGDPKQLGPVVKQKDAERLGLGRSMLERLFELKIYKRNSVTNEYDKNCITKLLESFRCDPRILKPCNKLFYDNELVCSNRTPPSLMRMLKLNKPLVLFHTKGKEERPPRSTSFQNLEEAEICARLVIMLYMRGLEPDQIGLMSTYKKQKYVLEEELSKKIESARRLLDERFQVLVGEKIESAIEPKTKLVAKELNWLCKIETIDSFQGSERDVIIISTVRSQLGAGLKNFAFLHDAKRFNVAISRAKWLVLVVGDGDVMGSSEYWRQLLDDSQRVSLS